MNRFLSLVVIVILAAASIVVAQSSNQATVRTPKGEFPITYVAQSGQTYLSASDVVAALGGTLTPDSTGYKATVNNTIAAFGPDSRFGVVREDLIEMPVAPITIEGRPFVPWQFFSGLLRVAMDMEATWDPTARVLLVQPRPQNVVSVQFSIANVQGTSKIVLNLSAPAEYAIAKEENTYVVRFRSPVQAPFTDTAYDDPHVSKASFAGNELRLQLTGPEVVGDAYALENPFRIVLDFRKGAAGPATGTPAMPGLKPAQPAGIRTIVIDPGHGGKEVGAVGPKGLMEKDVTLLVARKLAAALQSRVGARVVLTREDDSVVSLDQRTAIANQYQADLFLSIHMNAAVVKDARGSETYFLSLDATDDVAKRAAENENATSGGAAGSADLQLILWDLAHQEYVQESSRFASAIQEEMNAATSVQNRGVKQAPFKVLVGATMPAALVEVGFISNPEEEVKLQTEAFQTLMVDALTRAVQKYKNDYETRIGLVQPQRPAPPLTGGGTPPATTATAPPVKGRT